MQVVEVMLLIDAINSKHSARSGLGRLFASEAAITEEE